MKWIKRGLSLAVGLCLLCMAFRQTARVRFLQPTVSARFDRALTAEQVATARQYAQTDGIYLTFWAERGAYAENHIRTVQVRQITFDGEVDVACPVEYTFGRAPSKQETETCAVSTGVAWELWGGENVVGLEFTVEGKSYTVVGVFSGEQPVILRPDTGDFTAAEFQNIPRGEDSYRLAESLCLTCGLGYPDEILWGSGFAGWVSFLPWLCLVTAGLRLLLTSMRGVNKLPEFWRDILRMAFPFLVVLGLLTLLRALPPWLIPTRWSDFDFWSRLMETLTARCEDALSLTPMLRDVETKAAILRAIVLSLGSSAVLWRLKGHTEK